MLKEELNNLSTNDFYSLVLFVILQLKRLPEYAVLSELIYCVDKDSLLNLCKQFGGLTITIPTLSEMERVVNALLLYCYVNLEHKSFAEALSVVSADASEQEEIKSVYIKVLELLTNYDFRK